MMDPRSGGAKSDLLAYNQDEKVCPIINESQLYVFSACQNTIWALKTHLLF